MNLEEFLERNRISKNDWKNANITFDELKEIDSDYRQQMSHLNESAEFGFKANTYQIFSG